MMLGFVCTMSWRETHVELLHVSMVFIGSAKGSGLRDMA
jgi:hypothetical protein